MVKIGESGKNRTIHKTSVITGKICTVNCKILTPPAVATQETLYMEYTINLKTTTFKSFLVNKKFKGKIQVAKKLYILKKKPKNKTL